MELNPEQKAAVQHLDGPMLIVAGAGTGKTRVITERIAHLLNSKACTPAEILALTFTEKAANEMVERIDERLPLGYEELCVKTFHSFADQILRESGMEMGIDPGYKILTQTDQWFFFKKNLFEFELDYYRPLGNPNRFIYDILNHFSKLRDELVSPEKFLKYADGLEAGEEREQMLEIGKVYAKYQDLKMKNNFLDFGDLTYYALELLQKRESVLRRYQERFRFVMVDEFQDTNYAQFQMVLLLAQAHKNIVVVGDDDQSIYKWRGASLSNILQFEKHFPESKKVVLIENYRSSQKILDCAYALIQNNNPDRLEEREGMDKRLRANEGSDAAGKARSDEASTDVGGADAIADSPAPHAPPVEAHQFHSFVQEAGFVAEKIKALHETDGTRFSDFAVLIRTNQLAHPFIDEFKTLGIPYQVKNPKGLFALEEIKDLISVVKLLANPYDDIAMLRILKMPIFEISMPEILELLNNPEKQPLFKIISQPDDSPTLPGTESGTKKVATLFVDLAEFSRDRSVGEVLNEFINKSGYLNFLANNDKFEELENINEFAKQVSKFERENEDNSILDFVNYLNLLEESNSVFATDEFADRDSVQILTVHGSKGLEFDNVFVVSAVANRFPGINRRDTFELPAELTNEIFPEGDVHIQEERRLMYVAMTRAKKRLFLTYSGQYEGNKKWKPSRFVSELLDTNNAVLTEHEESEDAIAKLRAFKEPEKPIFNLPPFNRKKLSYSQLDTFKSCPLKYNYNYLMKVPTPPSHAANFGSSVHETLNEFYLRLKKGEKVDFDLMKELYEKSWIPYGYESKAHENTRKKKGLEILKNFYDTNSDPFVIPAYLERPFNLRIGDFWISGRIDRIDRGADGAFEVIDYKTGRLRKGANLKNDLQLSIYALACRDVFGFNADSLSLYYLEDNEKVSTTRSDEDTTAVEAQVLELFEEIKNSKFPPTPGFQCKFCDFRLICPAS